MCFPGEDSCWALGRAVGVALRRRKMLRCCGTMFLILWVTKARHWGTGKEAVATVVGSGDCAQT